MPAVRVVTITAKDLKPARAKAASKASATQSYAPRVAVADTGSAQDMSICDVAFPLPGTVEREMYRKPDGKPLSPHAWAVLDHIRTIPVGKVTTYKPICDSLGSGSPRTVGAALRNNPFAPAAPCHRVIASNLFLGGFKGEWGNDPSSFTPLMQKNMVEGDLKCDAKIDLLAKEGVPFDRKGYLKSREYLWDGKV